MVLPPPPITTTTTTTVQPSPMLVIQCCISHPKQLHLCQLHCNGDRQHHWHYMLSDARGPAHVPAARLAHPPLATVRVSHSMHTWLPLLRIPLCWWNSLISRKCQSSQGRLYPSHSCSFAQSRTSPHSRTLGSSFEKKRCVFQL